MSRRKLSKVCLSFTLSIFMLLFMANILPVTANDYILRLNKSEMTLTVGDKDTLTVVERRPKNMSIGWSSSNPEVAKVTYYGEVIAVGEGVATITATNTYASFECKVTVKAQQQTVVLESLRLDPSSVQLNIGDSIAPNPVTTPSTIDTTGIVWGSSDPGVATVQNGVIRAVSGGTAIIIASLMGKTASCTVDVAGAGLTLNKSDLLFSRPGDSEQLIATLTPANAEDKTITWTTTNPQVAWVDEVGTVRAVSDGVAIITARAGNHTADCRVQVETVIEVEGVSLMFDRHRLDIKVGESAPLYAYVYPTGAISSGFIWSSTDPSIATVDSNGMVTALKEGSTFISVESDGKKLRSPVNVAVTEKSEEDTVIEEEEISLEMILIRSDRTYLAELKKGEVISLYVRPVPISAAIPDALKPIRWESSNPAVATVDSRGKVTILSNGTVTIYAATATGHFEGAFPLRVDEPILPPVVDQWLKTQYRKMRDFIIGDNFHVLTPTATAGVRG